MAIITKKHPKPRSRARVVAVERRPRPDGSRTAVVFDLGAGTFAETVYCSTTCCPPRTAGACSAAVDAPPVVRAAYRAELALGRARLRAADAVAEAYLALDAERRYHTPSPDAVVEVVAGSRLPLGLRGRVAWAGRTSFGPRVQVVPEDGGAAVFLDAATVRVVEQRRLPAHDCLIAH